MEQMKQPTLQSAQAKRDVEIPRDLESFDQSRNPGAVHVGDIGEVNNDRFCRLPSQDAEEAVAKLWGGIDADVTTQSHNSALLAVIHSDLKAVSRNGSAASQHNSPTWLRARGLPYANARGNPTAISFHDSRLATPD